MQRSIPIDPLHTWYTLSTILTLRLLPKNFVHLSLKNLLTYGCTGKAGSGKICFNIFIYLKLHSSYCHNIWSVITMIVRLYFENFKNICKIESEENEFAKIYFRASTASFSRATFGRNSGLIQPVSCWHLILKLAQANLTPPIEWL